MNIGVPKEQASATFENRVGLTPDGVAILVAEGHGVYVQSKAGAFSGFSDEDYRVAGGEIVYSAEEAWGRSDLVAKVRAPVAGEFPLLNDSYIVAGFLHMAVAPRALMEALLHRRVTAIAYETIQSEDGRLPVVITMSEIAGRMIPLIAGELLMNTHGGKGILLGSIPGIAAADVVIIGAGVVGYNAACSFLGLGAQVVVELHPTDYVNDPFIICQNDRMISINSAIQIDLTGQVCADSIGETFYSGIGGQIDFTRGAARSKGGKPIIALPAASPAAATCTMSQPNTVSSTSTADRCASAPGC